MRRLVLVWMTAAIMALTAGCGAPLTSTTTTNQPDHQQSQSIQPTPTPTPSPTPSPTPTPTPSPTPQPEVHNLIQLPYWTGMPSYSYATVNPNYYVDMTSYSTGNPADQWSIFMIKRSFSDPNAPGEFLFNLYCSEDAQWNIDNNVQVGWDIEVTYVGPVTNGFACDYTVTQVLP